MKKSKKYEMDMCSGSIVKKMLIFAVPLMCSGVLQLLFNAADIVVVGRFAGDEALAAVGSNTALINLLTNLFIGLSIGSNVLAARFFGAKKEEELKTTVHTSMLLSVYSGIFLTIVGIVCAKQILIWMQAPPEVLDLAVTYLRIYFLGMTSTMIYNFGSAILRATGDTQRPLYYLIAAGIVNVLLNLFFVIVCSMSVAGVGLATAISQTVSAVLIIRCMMRERSAIRLEIKKLRIDFGILMKILQIGIPAGFQGIVFSLSNVVIQSAVNTFGKIVVAGNSAAANLEGFVYIAMNSFYQTTLSFTSQNYGAEQYKRIDKILITGLIYVVVTGLVFGNLVFLFGRQLLSIYSPSADVIKIGLLRLSIICVPYALCGIMDVLVDSLRGIGYSFMPMIVSLIGACGLRLLWLATIFQIPQYHTLQSIYISYPITWLITLCVHLVCFMWVRHRMTAKK